MRGEHCGSQRTSGSWIFHCVGSRNRTQAVGLARVFAHEAVLLVWLVRICEVHREAVLGYIL